MSPQELQVQGKREVEKKQESTIPARLFMPTADIFEDDKRAYGRLGNARCRQKPGRYQCRGGPAQHRWTSRLLQVRGNAARLHGIQHRPLSAQFLATQQDRPEPHRCRDEGRGSYNHHPQSRRGKAAQDLGELIAVIGRRTSNGPEQRRVASIAGCQRS